MNNPYVPTRAEILSVRQETHSDLDIKTYRLGLSMDFLPGQFAEVSVPGVGEAPFGFASDPFEKSFMELTIKRTGMLTDAIHALGAGDHLWIRGPFGNTFPLDQLRGRDILFIAGGLGLAPLRPLIRYVFHPSKRNDFGKIHMLLAARGSTDLIYRDEYASWSKEPDTKIALTIDRPEPNWTGLAGFPHNLVSEIPFDRENTTAVLCGPPIMIKSTARALQEMGVSPAHILTTLEMRMTCGVGKCGKCNIGHNYVCVDGPVFSLAELAEMPDEY